MKLEREIETELQFEIQQAHTVSVCVFLFESHRLCVFLFGFWSSLCEKQCGIFGVVNVIHLKNREDEETNETHIKPWKNREVSSAIDEVLKKQRGKQEQ